MGHASWRARFALVAGLAVVAMLLILPSMALAAPTLGSISGTVVNHATQAPIANIVVELDSVDSQGNWTWVDNGITDLNGAYQFTGLPLGDYGLYAYDLNIGYEPRYYQNATDQTLADIISLKNNAPDFSALAIQLPPYGHITGHVTRKRTGENLAGIDVAAATEISPGFWASIDSTTTDENGNYSLDFIAPAGAYHVTFSDGLTTYVDAAYQDVYSYPDPIDTSLGTTVTVPEGGTVSAIDQSMIDIALYPFETTPPVTSAIVDPDAARTSWSDAGTATVSLDATDNGGSGVASIWYATDPAGPRSVYSTPIAVNAEGTSTIYFGAVDKWGNAEATESVDVHLDHTAPVVNAQTTGSGASRSVTLSATDALSGVSAIVCRIDAGAETTYTGPIAIGLGNHTVEYRAVDNAGNWSTVQMQPVIVQVAPLLSTPSLSVSKPTHNKKFRIFGSKTPTDPFTSIVTLQIDRLIAGKWHSYARATVVMGAGATNYSVTVKISKKGNFRVRALHNADWVHVAGKSAYRSFKVK